MIADCARHGFPDPKRREPYTRGQCWLLALALTGRTGWPAFERTFSYPGLGQREHAYVRLPDGRWLDAEGCTARATRMRGR
jgi:hypothetical protein